MKNQTCSQGSQSLTKELDGNKWLQIEQSFRMINSSATSYPHYFVHRAKMLTPSHLCVWPWENGYTKLEYRHSLRSGGRSWRYERQALPVVLYSSLIISFLPFCLPRASIIYTWVSEDGVPCYFKEWLFIVRRHFLRLPTLNWAYNMARCLV